MYTTLVNATELADSLDSGQPVILDCRFSLTDTSAGFRDYCTSHLPGARYVDLDKDLSSAIIDGVSSRHPLPTQAWFVEKLRQWGADDDTQVIVYDDAGGAIAARCWWMCRWVGHQACAVLNGGFAAWCECNLPLSDQLPSSAALGKATLRPSLAPLVSADQLPDRERVLIDARTAERYAALDEPLDPIAGHIPGAVNLPFGDNLDSKGEFLPVQEIAQRFAAITADDPGRVIHYCGSGVTAAHNILAMLHAGLGMSALYAGSWSEWIQDPERPLVQGPEIG